MKVGFTGTRQGATYEQLNWLYGFIEQIPELEFHHGACLGADQAAACSVADYHGATLIAHPCKLVNFKSRRALGVSGKILPEKDPLERNKDIVDATELLIAFPSGPEELRSGTWSTVRFARKLGRPIIIVWTSGEITEENR